MVQSVPVILWGASRVLYYTLMFWGGMVPHVVFVNGGNELLYGSFCAPREKKKKKLSIPNRIHLIIA